MPRDQEGGATGLLFRCGRRREARGPQGALQRRPAAGRPGRPPRGRASLQSSAARAGTGSLRALTLLRRTEDAARSGPPLCSLAAPAQLTALGPAPRRARVPPRSSGPRELLRRRRTLRPRCRHARRPARGAQGRAAAGWGWAARRRGGAPGGSARCSWRWWPRGLPRAHTISTRSARCASRVPPGPSSATRCWNTSTTTRAGECPPAPARTPTPGRPQTLGCRHRLSGLSTPPSRGGDLNVSVARSRAAKGRRGEGRTPVPVQRTPERAPESSRRGSIGLLPGFESRRGCPLAFPARLSLTLWVVE